MDNLCQNVQEQIYSYFANTDVYSYMIKYIVTKNNIYDVVPRTLVPISANMDRIPSISTIDVFLKSAVLKKFHVKRGQKRMEIQVMSEN